MKTLIINYTFNASAKTVTFNDYLSGGISLASVLMVVDVTLNKVIYNFIDPNTGGTASGNVLTLTGTNLPTMNNGDALLIYYDDPLSQILAAITNAFAGEDLTRQVQGNILKPIVSSLYAPATFQDSGTITKGNIKAIPGNVYSMRILNANASIRYLQLHNKATVPVAADTAQLYFPIVAGTANNPGELKLDSSWFAPSEYFTLGIGFAISTTPTTFTDSATASDHSIKIRYA